MDGMSHADSEEGDVHVMPDFGRPHDGSSRCWCRPRPDPSTLDRTQYAHTVWIHEAQQ